MVMSTKRKLIYHSVVVLCYIGALVLFIPIVIFLIGTLIYRGCAWLQLKSEHGTAFTGFLKKHDALWAVEDKNSLSIIHTLVLFEGPPGSSSSTCDDLLSSALEKKLKVLAEQTGPSKMFQKRKAKWGYHFLVKVPPDQWKMEDYLRIVDVPSKSEVISKAELQVWIGGLYGQSLSEDHSKLFEILVCRKRFEGNDGQMLFPVVIRIHHSLADAVALVKLLDTSSGTTIEKELFDGSPRRSLREVLKHTIKSVKHGLRSVFILPRIIARQHRLVQPPDFNSLHNDKSSTSNFINWYHETESDALIHKVKAIKQVDRGITFQDVLCTALSAALYRHFSTKTDHCLMPEEITIGNAVQMEKPRELTNNCAYNFETIPVLPSAMNKKALVCNLNCIRQRRRITCNDQDVNYSLIELCALLPERYLRRLVSKNRCSTGMSNVPGPNEEVTIDKFRVKHLSFWTPNRFKTRLGITLFSLENKLHISIGGDRIAFHCAETESQDILDGLVMEINHMYALIKKE